MTTTHFALARELRHIAPDQAGETRKLMVADTADIIEMQDRRIDEATVILREIRSMLKTGSGDKELALRFINDWLGKGKV